MEKEKRRGPKGPYKTNKRDKQITLRMSETELERLGKCAEYYGKTRTNIIVEALEKFYKTMK